MNICEYLHILINICEYFTDYKNKSRDIYEYLQLLINIYDYFTDICEYLRMFTNIH